MKKEDLRIGILLYDTVREKEITLELKHFKELAVDDKCFFDRYKPIEISEEWLLKFGFRKISNMKYSKKGFVPYIIKGKNEFYASYVNYGIQFVHQLQNLYYALTGSELTIREQK